MLRNIGHQTKFFDFVPGFKASYVDTKNLQLPLESIEFIRIALYYYKLQFSYTEKRNFLLETVEECQSE